MSRYPLPMRDGVAPSYLYLPEGDWSDMISFLVARFPDVSEAAWRERMARGEAVPDDMLRWILARSESQGVADDDVASIQLGLSMAAIHTTTRAVTHV